MQKIADWLEQLGMSEYAKRFAENGIDVSVLPHLTDQDLKDIGVLLGHRRKMLAAIAELGDAFATTPKLAVTEPKPQDTAERRQVTVMFSDLVGSTALSARMDPEDLREIIAAYQKCVAETVQRFGGFVAKYMGDGVLVYFGYPLAHEDDADRAVRAGLGLIEAVSALKSPLQLKTRHGIATGLVVVGDLVGSGEAQERGIVGETPNLAARLQSIAEPNMVVIAESTRKLLGNLFEIEDLGAQDLKGLVGPVRAWVALRPSSAEGRFEAFHASSLTELVGRDKELNLLLSRWSKAKTGDGQVVLLSGEAGIGKSRLTAALLERLAVEPHTRIRYFCSPQHTDSAFFPIIGQIERAAGFAHDDTAQAKLDKLNAVLAQVFTPPEHAALFAEMVSLSNDGRYPTLEMAPQQRRLKTMEALTAQLEGLSRQKPVLMIFEDAQWADPSSLETIGRVLDRIKTLGVLLIVTHRPEFEPPWIGRPHVTALILNRLGESQIAAIINGLTGNKLLSPNIKQDIIERTDGIPLFAEEMTKAVLEAESEGNVRQIAAAVPSPAPAVPASLHASLMARLDRLGTAKEVAQIGSAIGREFSHALLAAVARKPKGELDEVLDRLIHAGLLFRQGMPPDTSYLFKHALVQDAAYGTLLREPRRALHARIAEVIENLFSEVADSQPELLAHHCTEAGQIEKAAKLWGRAGQRSFSRSALIEAIEQLRRALSQLTGLPTTTASRRERISLQVALIWPLEAVRGWAAPETIAAIDQARQLIEEAETLGETLENSALPYQILTAAWIASMNAFNGDVFRQRATEYLALAEKQQLRLPIWVGHYMLGFSLVLTGEMPEGRAHLDQALSLNACATERERELSSPYFAPCTVEMLMYRSFAMWLCGYPEVALASANQAVNNARQIGDAYGLMAALSWAMHPHMWCGNYDTEGAILDELCAVAKEKGAAAWETYGMGHKGELFVLTGHSLEAISMITAGIAEMDAMGSTLWRPGFLSSLAAAHAHLGKFNDAWREIGDAITTMEATKERCHEAEVHRTAGEIALLEPKPNATKAEAYFNRALDVARKQQAKSWELRSAMSVARLWRSQGKPQQARELLAPVYGWFTEGFDTRDLKEAKALLGQLEVDLGVLIR